VITTIAIELYSMGTSYITIYSHKTSVTLSVMYYADMTSHMHTVYRQGGVVIHRINATLEDVAATINKPSETTHSAVC